VEELSKYDCKYIFSEKDLKTASRLSNQGNKT